MAARVSETSKLGNRYQTTVPKGVRRHLNLGKGDRIRYSSEPGGRVYMEAEESTREDHAVGAFLDFLADDMEKHPERLKPIGDPLLDHARELVKNIEVYLDMPLSPDDELQGLWCMSFRGSQHPLQDRYPFQSTSDSVCAHMSDEIKKLLHAYVGEHISCHMSQLRPDRKSEPNIPGCATGE